MKKIKCFTFLELLVVLIITSLLMFFSISLLINFNQYLRKTLKEQALGSQILWFEKTLKDDLIQSDFVTGNSEVFRIHNSLGEKSYEFYPNKVLIRTIDYTDTIPVEVVDCKIDYIENTYIKYIELGFKYNGRIAFLCQNKTYDPKFLLELWIRQNN